MERSQVKGEGGGDRRLDCGISLLNGLDVLLPYLVDSVQASGFLRTTVLGLHGEADLA